MSLPNIITIARMLAVPLIVVTLESPVSYLPGRPDSPGLEAELARRLAETLDVDLDLRVKSSTEDLMQAMAARTAHIAAPGFPVSVEKEGQAGPAYAEADLLMVCRVAPPLPADFAQIAKRSLTWTVSRDIAALVPDTATNGQTLPISQEQALEHVWLRKDSCTIIDERTLKFGQRLYPEVRVAFKVAADRKIRWILADGAGDLESFIADWFAGLKKSGELARLEKQYVSFLPKFDYVDTARFRERIRTRLRRYERYFRIAARRTDLPWQLLAAMAYQESHWDPNAKSPTGVRGIMMLTKPTASELGVDDRTDAAESIMGGALYFADLMARLPEEINGQDRIFFALAAYNMGFNHIADARRLAARQGKDKNAWADVREILPQLQRGGSGASTGFGYARGGEARRYVQQVRTYWQILELGRR